MDPQNPVNIDPGNVYTMSAIKNITQVYKVIWVEPTFDQIDARLVPLVTGTSLFQFEISFLQSKTKILILTGRV
jgi:hypothetical protein